MSTNEEKTEAAVKQLSSLVPQNLSVPTGLPAGLPDPSALARLATQIFNDFPAEQRTASDFAEQAQGLASPAGPDELSLLTPQALASLPLELALDPGQAQSQAKSVAASVPAPVSGVGIQEFSPNSFSSIASRVSPPFSFLETARPIFAGAAPVPTVPTIPSIPAVPGEALSASAFYPPASVPGVPGFAEASTFAEPAVAGAWRKLPAAEAFNPFDFIESSRPIAPISVQPVIEPLPAKPAPITDLGFSHGQFEVGAIRRDFPILQERVNGRQLVWLDNAATTQKPQAVIDRLSYFYSHENSNVHRAAHELAARSTDAYEAAREKTRRFLNAPSAKEIVFVRGATEGINLVAKSWGWQNVHKDDEIVITWLEHHANIVPWQMLCAAKGANLRVAPVDNRGDILLDEYTKLIGPKTRLVAIPQVSNALGTVTPSREMIEIAHRNGAKVLLDGAQAVSHIPVDVQLLDCDFYVFSGHKVFAPTGIGVVYGKPEVLAQTPPWQGGGNMIADVTFEKTIYQPPPGRFEAGTGNIADAVGLGAAIDYVQRVGMPSIARYEHDLLAYGLESLRTIPGLRLIGAPKEQAGVISFVLDGFRTEDVGAALNREGIAVRAGHHCAQPILRRFGLESTVRASLALYNTCEEIDALVAAIWNLKSGRGPGIL
jgi:cysteine desulfurase / selenocysteine lyase